ncbi:expansin EXLX1 family cellulose-binding protein [Tenacibaculum sp. M341]|uniref:expansin EXLX1 family cellulose-binding protein n=1 Tax=Tenacibaculum sp. M341 TaxID=2530339 RepID=UPI001050749C|nr:expansin EXLX1 family cellulose-binding protein [Tenacibaculum sp. M341]TCI91051.1 hypothetical protein EYW44_11925 [Tenacibaculum sp. M341]
MKNLLLILITFLSYSSYAQYRTGGAATFYGGVDGGAGGNCSILVKKGDKMHCAINDVDYKNSNACGAYVEVIGPKGKVVLQVVDRCPECPKKKVTVNVNGQRKRLPVHLDLTQEAFAKIGNPINGAEAIKWRFVDNPNKKQKMKLRFKSGSTVYWTGVQIYDTKSGVKKVEYLANNNKWKTMVRQPYNFFLEPAGVKVNPVQFRVTSVKNQVIVLNKVNISGDENKVFYTGKQFGGRVTVRSSFTNEDNEQLSKAIFPNPSNNIVHLNKEKPVKWVLLKGNTKIKSGYSKNIDLEAIPSGKYYVKFLNGDKTQVLIKK